MTFEKPAKQENIALGVAPEQPKTEIIEEERKKAAERLSHRSFKTEKGSVYTYDREGHTKRYKTTTGETFEAQDVTIFVNLNDGETQIFLDAIDSDLQPERKVYVIERGYDDKPKIIRSFSDVIDPDRLYLAIVQDGKIISSKQATLRPTMGYTVFDTKHFEEGEKWKTARHLGHRVVGIADE